MRNKIVWVVPEIKGGIQTYAAALWPAVRGACGVAEMDSCEPLYLGRDQRGAAVGKLKALAPTLIHIQHEYGLFGGKVPPFYRFPAWIKKLRKALPEARIVATGHTVLDSEFRYSVAGRGVQAPLRWVANHSVVPLLTRRWNRGTWGVLDGVIVHSGQQQLTVSGAGSAKVQVIPHYVPGLPFGVNARPVSRNPIAVPALAGIPPEESVIIVFGYVSPEKGQNVAIEAFSRLRVPARLILAGGLRREKDRFYFERCEALIREKGLGDRVKISGFVPEEQITALYARATLVLVPFVETSGSGSLAQAFARHAPVLASDLSLNREIAEREAGALAFFKSGDAGDCARQLEVLLGDEPARNKLREASSRYAEQCSPSRVAEQHLEFYRLISEGI